MKLSTHIHEYKLLEHDITTGTKRFRCESCGHCYHWNLKRADMHLFLFYYKTIKKGMLYPKAKLSYLIAELQLYCRIHPQITHLIKKIIKKIQDQRKRLIEID